MKIRRFRPDRLKFISDFLELGLVDHEVVLAGGSLRGLFDTKDIIQDYDLFFVGLNEAETKRRKDNLEEELECLGFCKTFQCPLDELRCFRHPEEGSYHDMLIQLIDIKHTYYEDVEDLLDSFDINAGRYAYDGETIYMYRESISDVKRKHISLNKVKYPVATINRIAKYSRKGYRTTNASRDFVKIMQDPDAVFDMDVETVYVD